MFVATSPSKCSLARRVLRQVALLGIAALAAQSALAVDEDKRVETKPGAENAAQPHDITPAEIQGRIKAAEAATDLDPALRTRLVETYTKLLQQMQLAAEASSRGAGYEASAAQAPEKLQKLKQSPAQSGDSAAPAVPPEISLADAQQALSKAEMRLAETKKALASLQDEPKRRADRRAQIPELQATAKSQLEEVEKQLALKPPEGEPAELVRASRMLLEARQRALQHELQAYQQEIAAYEATTELLTMQRDQAVVQHSQAEQAVKVWQTAVNERRRREAEQQAREARLATIRAHPAVKQVAAENAELAAQRQSYAEKIESTLAESKRLEETTQKLEEQLEQVMQRAERVGLTQTIGLLLRKRREELPSARRHTQRIAALSDEIAELSLHALEFEEQRSELADLDAAADRRIASMRNSVNAIEMPMIRDELAVLLKSKREYLDSLIADATRYQDRLQELISDERGLVAEIERFKSFADENILWIRSAPFPGIADASEFQAAIRWLLAPQNWVEIGRLLRDDIYTHAAAYAVFGLCSGLLAFCQHIWRNLLRARGREAAKGFATRFRPTVEALLLTLLMAAGWPSIIWLAGWRINSIGSTAGFSSAVGSALQVLALLVVTLELPRQVCRHQGLAEAHFGWSAGCLRNIRQSLHWLTLIGLPAAAVVLITEAQPNEQWKATLGRLAFVVAQAITFWSVYRIWQAPQGLVHELLQREPEQKWRHFQRFWHVATIAAPAVLLALAVAGFYYTAVQLAWWLLGTVWLLYGVVILHASLMRWLLLAYRELAIQRARERRAAEAAAQASSEGKPAQPEATLPESAVSLSDVNLQTRNLVRLAAIGVLLAGTWLIWRDVLPALNVFRRVSVWPSVEILDSVEVENAPDGLLTLANILLAILILLITFAGARNIPGLLELTLWRRLPLDAGVRYAIAAVSRYAITVVGVVAACGNLGLAWSQVQWLAAAISVGLGFGLQEIFANFVSGLILLFERPIRIGDVVSVGDVTGKVSRIQIRATTVLDWDLRELVIPNKELITGRVMNWTLSSTTARMTIKVGVAYGSDPDAVQKLLLQIARDNSLVLNDPPAHALLDEFGDSALSFTLRVYISSLNVFLQVRHELLTAISSALRDADIEIPFPQRDLHLRSIPAGVAASAAKSAIESNGHM